MNTHNPQTYRFFLMTVDPVHIGTGGARLGRVDNPIVREPGTHLPKFPGSSLHGMTRQYAAHRYGKPQCAGQGQPGEGKMGHCGLPTCPICYTFGAITGEHSYAGVVSIGDARILLFPVYSMVGPVWVTSPAALRDAGLGEVSVAADRAKWGGELPTDKPLNLGWLMVEREEEKKEDSSSKSLKGVLGQLPSQIPQQIRDRIALVSDTLFSQIVNSNLEVRTSVSINPETGAAEEGALFTYEAIPRATVLWMDVVVDDYRDKFPDKKRWEEICVNTEEKIPPHMRDSEIEALRKLGYIGERPKKREEESEEEFEQRRRKYWERAEKARRACQNALNNLDWSAPIDVVVQGLEWARHLGIGGMGTRGFGRVRDIVHYEVQDDGSLGELCRKDAHGDTEATENAKG